MYISTLLFLLLLFFSWLLHHVWNLYQVKISTFNTLTDVVGLLFDRGVWCACPLAFLCLELKDGRIPQGLSSWLGYWKTEEFQKFSYPVSELLLAGLLEPMEYHLWQLTARMTELIFNKRNGWSLDDCLLFQNLAKRYIILNEEHRGLTACRITVHNLQHIPEDAYQFSHPDNYWCFPYERAVKRYVSISSNFKNMECSFAKREGYRELLKLLRGRIQPQEETKFKFDLEKASIYMHSLLFTITCTCILFHVK